MQQEYECAERQGLLSYHTTYASTCMQFRDSHPDTPTLINELWAWLHCFSASDNWYYSFHVMSFWNFIGYWQDAAEGTVCEHCEAVSPTAW